MGDKHHRGAVSRLSRSYQRKDFGLEWSHQVRVAFIRDQATVAKQASAIGDHNPLALIPPDSSSGMLDRRRARECVLGFNSRAQRASGLRLGHVFCARRRPFGQAGGPRVKTAFSAVIRFPFERSCRSHLPRIRAITFDLCALNRQRGRSVAQIIGVRQQFSAAELDQDAFNDKKGRHRFYPEPDSPTTQGRFHPHYCQKLTFSTPRRRPSEFGNSTLSS